MPNKSARRLALALLLCFSSATLDADTFVAYEVPEGTAGTQAFGGALGMDFDVQRALTVTRLGVFDDASDGLNRTITARLWDRASETELASMEFSPEDPGELVGGSRFKALDPPLVLAQGFQGVIVAEGYGDGERLANSGGVPPIPWTTNDGGICALEFVGTSRFGVTPGEFPGSPDGGPANRYAAGTFEYDVDPPPEEPIAYALDAGTVGNQAFGGSLGHDFDVVDPIDITALGVFDDGSDGLNLTITARLYDRAAQSELASLVFSPDEPGELIGGSRFKALAEPVTLSAGFQGSIVAEGYGEGEQDLNAGAPDFITTDDGGCLIDFVGSGRWGNAGEFPGNPDVGPPDRFGGPTFRFRRATAVAPPPPGELIATDGEDGRVPLSWSPPAGGPAIAGYNVYRTRPAPRTKLNAELIADTQLVVDGLINGVEHCFVVRAVSDVALEGADSSEACARPATAAAPAMLVVSHQVPEGTEGNQAFGGSLGMDFEVNTAIVITRLGVFDDASDGLNRVITARLWSMDDGAELASIEFTPEDPGELAGGSRFKSLEHAIELPAGFRATIVAEGYGDDDPATEDVDERERNGNRNIGPLDLATDSADCSISFTGSRFGDAGAFPAAFNAAAVTNAFAAGTFEYGPVGAPPGPAGGIAYVVPEGTAGNQAFGGSLGMDFNVLADIRVTRLGVFDDGSNGLVLPLTARVFNRDSLLELATVAFTPEEPGELIGGSRFKDLAEPLCLPEGFRGVIEADGYGDGELLANGGAIPITWSVDDGGCLVEFVGSGRFGDPGAFPGTADGGPQNRYAAGTFVFEPSDEPCILPPEPPLGISIAAGDGEVTLTWQAVEGTTPAATYRVLRSVDGGPFDVVAEVDVTEFNDTGLENGVDVCYRVRSVSADGRESDDDSRTICATPGARVPGRIVAYEVPGGVVGNQDGLDTAFGLDFDTVSRIRIHRLGVFDDGTDGLGTTLRVSLHNRQNGVELAAIEFTPEDPGVLIGGNRFKSLALPLALPAGFTGSVVAEGFSMDERISIGGNFPTNPGPCAIEFINSRSGPAGEFPPDPGAAVSIHGPAAGSFEFEALDVEVPTGGGVAYVIPEGTIGNQAFGGALGMDFDVQGAIVVTRLGVFDDGSDGLNLPISARLYDRDSREVIVALEFTPEDGGELVGGSRFKSLDAPLELQPGFRGSIVASGYGAQEQNGNQGGVDLGLGLEDGGCLISFVNGGRFGQPGDPAGFPGVADGGPANRYAAGTFEFRPPVPPCPAEGDTHCIELAISGPEGNVAGVFIATAVSASDDSGDPILYTFTFARGFDPDDEKIIVGPQLENVAELELEPGLWSVSVTVDDDLECDDVADDATCGPIEINVGVPALQVPGDCNQDGRLDISDASCVFGVLFLGTPEAFPCGDGLPGDAGNLGLLDWQPDGNVDLSDGVAILNFLFSGGPPHTRAVGGNEITGCIIVPGCPDSPSCE